MGVMFSGWSPLATPWRFYLTLVEPFRDSSQRRHIFGLKLGNDNVGQRPWSPNRFHAAFDKLRGELAERHESFPTRYAVKHYPAEPMRVLRHTPTLRLSSRCGLRARADPLHHRSHDHEHQ